MNPVAPGTGPKRRVDLDLRHEGDGAVLLADDGHEVGALDATAAALWELCDGQTSIDEIVHAVCSVWAVDADVARRDVETALSQLADAGFLEERP